MPNLAETAAFSHLGAKRHPWLPVEERDVHSRMDVMSSMRGDDGFPPTLLPQVGRHALRYRLESIEGSARPDGRWPRTAMGRRSTLSQEKKIMPTESNSNSLSAFETPESEVRSYSRSFSVVFRKAIGDSQKHTRCRRPRQLAFHD
jgi:hypothetical protein